MTTTYECWRIFKTNYIVKTFKNDILKKTEHFTDFHSAIYHFRDLVNGTKPEEKDEEINKILVMRSVNGKLDPIPTKEAEDLFKNKDSFLVFDYWKHSWIVASWYAKDAKSNIVGDQAGWRSTETGELISSPQGIFPLPPRIERRY